MRTTLDGAVETALELLVALVDVAATIGLAAIGLSAELTSVSTFGTDTTMALWMAYVGTIALVGCWMVLTDRVVPRFVAA